MSEKNDGGHAFPNITPDMNVDGGPGMSLRDWFAGQALAGIASINAEGFSLPPEQEAELAYQRADAMLKARQS